MYCSQPRRWEVQDQGTSMTPFLFHTHCFLAGPSHSGRTMGSFVTVIIQHLLSVYLFNKNYFMSAISRTALGDRDIVEMREIPALMELLFHDRHRLARHILSLPP